MNLRVQVYVQYCRLINVAFDEPIATMHKKSTFTDIKFFY